MGWLGLNFMGSMIGGKGARNAARRQARAIQQATMQQTQQMRELAAPYLEMGQFAMPRLKNLVSSFGSKMGQENPLYRAQHKMNLSDIGRQTQRALASAMHHWKRSGNASRAWGSQLAIGRNALEARNRENLGYGLLQQNYMDNMANRYMSGLGSLANLGLQGSNFMRSAINSQAQGLMSAEGARAQGDMALWNSIGGFLANAKAKDYWYKGKEGELKSYKFPG